MLKNQLLTVYRSLLRNKEYAFINIIGLTVSIAACLVLFYMVSFELSFDSFHPKKDRIYRITNEVTFEDGMDYGQGVPAPLPEAMRLDFPQLTVGTIFSVPRSQVDVLDEKQSDQVEYMEDLGVFFAEPDFFNILDFGWLHGSPDALREPNSVVLTRAIAEKYFGDWKNAIGKSIEYNNRELLKVTGIINTPPPNSDFPLKVVISFATRGQEDQSWGNISSRRQCYVLLDEHTNAAQIQSLMPAFEDKNQPAEDNVLEHYVLQPLSGIHFDTHLGNFNNRTVSRTTLWSLALIGLMLIITASINFVNLAIAQVMRRSKEVGVRKVLGSNRWQLSRQFYGETFLILLVASILAVVVTQAALPTIQTVLSLPANFRAPGPAQILLVLAVLIAAVTLFSGYYPAHVLGSFQPAQALKSKINSQAIGGVPLRKGLVVVQFAIAQVLVIATLVVVKQLDFIHSTPLGFERDSIILFNVPTDSLNRTKSEAFRHTLLQEPEIENITFSFSAPLSGSNRRAGFRFNNSTEDAPFEVNMKFADLEYFSTYNLPLVAGRLYQPADSVREYVVNEALLARFGITNPEDGLGKTITVYGATCPIVGVLKDFHLLSLQDKIEPLAMSYYRPEFGTVGVKLQAGSMKPALKKIKEAYGSFYTDNLFQYRFFNENVERLYNEEERLSSITQVFSAMAIFISSLGLYGLISFMAVQRTKEVGIRKVLGASVREIVFLFYKEFIALVLVASVISAPLTGYFMTDWLNSYAYKVDLSPWIFVLAIALTTIVCVVTVSFRSIKAAMANPVDSLKNE
jgi:putative ABC transport system permease protein